MFEWICPTCGFRASVPSQRDEHYCATQSLPDIGKTVKALSNLRSLIDVTEGLRYDSLTKPISDAITLLQRAERIEAAARNYITLLESCADGYYRVQESDEATAWETANG